MKRIFALLIITFISFEVFAQSSSVITDILETDQVTLGQVCYLSAVQQGLIDENAGYTEAIDALYKLGQIPVASYDSTLVPLVNISYIFAQMWNIKGGLFYRIFHGAPRYAYKQMKSDGILPENSDPGLIVSGQELLNIYTACSVKYGNMSINID